MRTLLLSFAVFFAGLAVISVMVAISLASGPACAALIFLFVSYWLWTEYKARP